MQTKAMTTNQEANHLENLKKQIHLSDCIDILMKQSLKLMDMVNANQKEINDLKSEQEKLTLTSSDDIKGGW
jgi:hypothetical protein